MKTKPFQRKTKEFSFTLVFAALGLLCTGTVHAQIVSFNFSGTTTFATEDPGGHLAGLGIGIGTPYTGQITYDAAQAGPDLLGAADAGGYAFPAGVYSFSLSVAGHTFSSNPADASHQINVFNPTTGSDSLQYGFSSAKLDGGSLPGSPAISFASLEIYDNTRTALASALLPTTAPDLSKFQTARSFYISANAVDNSTVWYLGGNITSISPVPEPAATGAVIATGLAGFALWRRRCSKGTQLDAISD